MMPALFFGELSNPFGILNKYFKIKKKEELEKIFGISFVLIFLIVRVIVTPIIAVPILISKTPLTFKLCVSSMWFIGMNWAWMMLNKAAKQLSESVSGVKGVYFFVKKMRKYSLFYNVLSGLFCYSWIVFGHFGIWKY